MAAKLREMGVKCSRKFDLMDTQKWFEISNEVKTILVWQITVEKENQFTPNNKTANGGNERSDYLQVTK